MSIERILNCLGIEVVTVDQAGRKIQAPASVESGAIFKTNWRDLCSSFLETSAYTSSAIRVALALPSSGAACREVDIKGKKYLLVPEKPLPRFKDDSGVLKTLVTELSVVVDDKGKEFAVFAPKLVANQPFLSRKETFVPDEPGIGCPTITVDGSRIDYVEERSVNRRLGRPFIVLEEKSPSAAEGITFGRKETFSSRGELFLREKYLIIDRGEIHLGDAALDDQPRLKIVWGRNFKDEKLGYFGVCPDSLPSLPVANYSVEQRRNVLLLIRHGRSESRSNVEKTVDDLVRFFGRWLAEGKDIKVY